MSTPGTSGQTGKTLQLYLTQLSESEKQNDDQKIKLNSAKIEIKNIETLLSEVTDEVKTIDDKIIAVYSRLPTAVSETVVIESDNKILCHQINCFESKIEEIKQKISETDVKYMQEMDQLVEQSFAFIKDYGLDGRIRCQTEDLRRNVEKLRAKRNQLKDEIRSVNTSDSTAILSENKSLINKINDLNRKKSSLSEENYELKCIETSLKTRLNEIQIKTKTGKEIKSLQKQLDELENKTNQIKTIEPIVPLNDPKSFESASEVFNKKQKLSVNFKDEPKIIDISDDSFDDSIQSFIDLPKKTETTGQSPEKKSEYFLEKKKEIENELKTKITQNLWELKRKRRQILLK